MKGKRYFLVVASIATMSLILAACGDGGDGGTDGDKPTVKIAFIGALSGDYAELAVHASHGAELAVEQANEAGDLPVIIEYVAQDSQGSGDKATPIANQLKDDDQLVALVGPAFTGESLAVNPILNRAGIPQITPSATNPAIAAQKQVAGKTWWRAVGNDSQQGGVEPDVLTKYLKAESVYIAHDKSPYGQGLADIVRDGLDDSLEAGFEGVDAGKKDYSSLVTNVVNSDADVFFWGGYSPEGALIAEQLRDRGSDIQFLGADGSKDSTFLKAGDAVEGAVLTCPCTDPNSVDDEASQSFVEDYEATHGHAPGVYAAEGFDAANIMIDAIRAAGAPGDDILEYRAEITATIDATSGYEGIANTYSFEENGDLATDRVEIYLYKVENGAFTFLGNVEDLV